MRLVMNGVTAVSIANFAVASPGDDPDEFPPPLSLDPCCSRLSVVPPCSPGVPVIAPRKETPMKSKRTREQLSAALLSACALPASAALVACLSGCGDDLGSGPIDAGVQDQSASVLKPPSGVPAVLQPPAGSTVAVLFHGRGDQVYICTSMSGGGSDGGTMDGGTTSYAWVLNAPDAKLYDDAGKQGGTHYAGPTWTANDQSSVVAMRVQQVNAPQSGSISWLLLKAISNAGTGLLSSISFVQRVYTQGGVAPTSGCDAGTVGTTTRVAYSAEYYFYVGGG